MRFYFQLIILLSSLLLLTACSPKIFQSYPGQKADKEICVIKKAKKGYSFSKFNEKVLQENIQKPKIEILKTEPGKISFQIQFIYDSSQKLYPGHQNKYFTAVAYVDFTCEAGKQYIANADFDLTKALIGPSKINKTYSWITLLEKKETKIIWGEAMKKDVKVKPMLPTLPTISDIKAMF